MQVVGTICPEDVAALAELGLALDTQGRLCHTALAELLLPELGCEKVDDLIVQAMLAIEQAVEKLGLAKRP